MKLIRATLLSTMVLASSLPPLVAAAQAQEQPVPAQTCSGQDCGENLDTPIVECKGQDCLPPPPDEKPAEECEGEGCTPVPAN